MRESKLSRILGRHLPTTPQHDDLYIVEFPKSGITWVSTILAHLCKASNSSASKQTPNIKFYLNDVVPDIHMSRNIGSFDRDCWPHCRLIKSHAYGNRQYLKVVYIVRHPIAVMGSYYDYCRGLGQFSGSFSAFIRHPHLGIRAWDRHVKSWAGETSDAQRILLLKYENLRENAELEISRVLEAMGLPVESNALAAAVSQANFSRMRAVEHELATISMHKLFRRFEKFVFVNKGRSSDDVSLSDTDHSYIQTIAGDTMAQLGYG